MAQVPVDSPFPQPRTMTVRDLAKVLSIERESYPTPWSLDYFRQCILAGYECWVIDRGEGIECYSILSLAGTTAHLLNLCVRRDSRGTGLGRYMLRAVLDFCREKAVLVLLEVRPSNHVAINLYRSMGFREFGIRPGYYRDRDGREDALVMVKRF